MDDAASVKALVFSTMQSGQQDTLNAVGTLLAVCKLTLDSSKTSVVGGDCPTCGIFTISLEAQAAGRKCARCLLALEMAEFGLSRCSVPILRQLLDAHAKALALLDQATEAAGRKDYPKAVILCDKAAREWQDLGHESAVLGARIHRAGYLADEGRKERALEEFLRAEHGYRQMGDVAAQAGALMHRSMNFRGLDTWGLSLLGAARAGHICRGREDHDGCAKRLAQALGWQAFIYSRRIADATRARDLLREARATWRILELRAPGEGFTDAHDAVRKIVEENLARHPVGAEELAGRFRAALDARDHKALATEGKLLRAACGQAQDWLEHVYCMEHAVMPFFEAGEAQEAMAASIEMESGCRQLHRPAGLLFALRVTARIAEKQAQAPGADKASAAKKMVEFEQMDKAAKELPAEVERLATIVRGAVAKSDWTTARAAAQSLTPLALRTGSVAVWDESLKAHTKACLELKDPAAALAHCELEAALALENREAMRASHLMGKMIEIYLTMQAHAEALGCQIEMTGIAVDAAERAFPSQPREPKVKLAIAELHTLLLLAYTCADTGKPKLAIRAYEAVTRFRGRVMVLDPGNLELRVRQAGDLDELGITLMAHEPHRHSEGLQHIRKAYEMMEQINRDDPAGRESREVSRLDILAHLQKKP